MNMADRDTQLRARMEAALKGGKIGVVSNVILSIRKRPWDGLLDYLQGALTQPDDVVRAMAAYALGMLGDPRAIEPLMLSFKSDLDGVVQAHVAESLGVLGAHDAIPLLEAALDSRERSVRESVVRSLSRLGALPLAALQQNLVAQDPKIRAETVLALEETGDTRALPLLLAAIEDPDSTVRRHAACALGQFRDAIAVGPLIGHLTDPGMEVAWCAAHSLGAIGDVRAVEPLMVLLMGHTDHFTRQEAAVVLGKLGDRRAATALTRALQDPDTHVKRAASSALAQLGVIGPAPAE